MQKSAPGTEYETETKMTFKDRSERRLFVWIIIAVIAIFGWYLIDRVKQSEQHPTENPTESTDMQVYDNTISDSMGSSGMV